MPKMPEFEIDIRPVTAGESGPVYPDWAELSMEIGHGNNSHLHPLTRAAGEEVVEQMRRALNPRGGNSIVQKIWTELDSAVDELTEFADTVKESGEVTEQTFKEWGQLQGRPQGLALALAILRNPYAPNVDAIKAEARDRARERRGDA